MSKIGMILALFLFLKRKHNHYVGKHKAYASIAAASWAACLPRNAKNAGKSSKSKSREQGANSKVKIRLSSFVPLREVFLITRISGLLSKHIHWE